MNCPRCKTNVTQQDKYCPSCGLPLGTARKGGPKKPAVKKAYEEASTQLVDVDEFKKYMNDEKAKAPVGGKGADPDAGPKLATGTGRGSAASQNLAVSPGGNPSAPLSGDSAPDLELAKALKPRRPVLIILGIVIVVGAIVALLRTIL